MAARLTGVDDGHRTDRLRPRTHSFEIDEASIRPMACGNRDDGRRVIDRALDCLRPRLARLARDRHDPSASCRSERAPRVHVRGKFLIQQDNALPLANGRVLRRDPIAHRWHERDSIDALGMSKSARGRGRHDDRGLQHRRGAREVMIVVFRHRVCPVDKTHRLLEPRVKSGSHKIRLRQRLEPPNELCSPARERAENRFDRLCVVMGGFRRVVRRIGGGKRLSARQILGEAPNVEWLEIQQMPDVLFRRPAARVRASTKPLVARAARECARSDRRATEALDDA